MPRTESGRVICPSQRDRKDASEIAGPRGDARRRVELRHRARFSAGTPSPSICGSAPAPPKPAKPPKGEPDEFPRARQSGEAKEWVATNKQQRVIDSATYRARVEGEIRRGC